MAPIMFGTLAPLQYTLESRKLAVYLSHAGQPLAIVAGIEAQNRTTDGDETAADSTNPTYWELSIALLSSALLALALNVAEMMLVEATSALTLNIANTAKFAAIILLSVLLFSTELSLLRVIGIVLCISGVGLFNIHKARTAKAKAEAMIKNSDGREQAELELQPLLLDSAADGGVPMGYSASNDDAVGGKHGLVGQSNGGESARARDTPLEQVLS